MTAVSVPSKIDHLKQLFDLAQARHSGTEEIFVLNNVTWEEFNELLDLLPDNRGTLFRYLKGELEIMAPGRNHELIKQRFCTLFELYLMEKEIDYIALGSITFRKTGLKKSVEPDQCYCLNEEKDYPDLVFEVVITSGGIDLLEIYKDFGVREVWFWKQDQITIFILENGEYQESSNSFLDPDLEKAILEKYLISTESSFLKLAKAFRKEIF